jgi:hypothetical protein
MNARMIRMPMLVGKIKPKWLICSNCYTDGNPEKMRDAAQHMGCEVSWFKYVPFEHDKSQKLGFDNGEDCVISYGSIQLSKLVERVTKWTPGSWTSWEKLTCSHYLSHWGQNSIHETYAYVTLSDLRRRWQELFNIFGTGADKSKRMFIKPDGNEKAFHGEVVNISCYDEWWKYTDCYSPAPELMCLISSPAEIDREWRLIVSGKKVVAGSQYRKRVNGESSVEIEPGYPKEIEQFAEQIMQTGTYEPAPIYCLDVCETIKNDLKLVELGGLNCAGLYDADITKVVEKANEVAQLEWDDLYGF